MKLKVILFLLYFASTSTTYAQIDYDIDEVEVTAFKYNEIKKYIANTVYVLDSTDLKSMPASSLSEVLSQIPGVHIQQAFGNTGSVKQYTMRGGQPKDISILVNGVVLCDNSQITNFQDLNLIDLSNVERIEVISGGSTTLYGSNASAGVINIVLKDAFGKKQIQTSISYGSWNTIQASLQAKFPIQSDKLFLQTSANYNRTNGFSAARDTIGGQNFDRDGSDYNQFGLQLGYRPNDQVQLTVQSNITNFDFDFDSGAFLDGDNKQNSEQWNNQMITSFEQSRGKSTLQLGWTSNRRIQSNQFGRLPDYRFSEFESSQLQAEFVQLQQLYAKKKWSINLIAGIFGKSSKTNQFGMDYFTGEYIQTIAQDSAKFTSLDPYLSTLISKGKFYLDFGGRYHWHNSYDGDLVYHVKPKVELLNTDKFQIWTKGGFYTSYNIPSLYQLFSDYGSTDLVPESSQSLEASLSADLNKKWSGSLTYFTRKNVDQIGFSTVTYKYANLIGNSKVDGVEMLINSKIEDYLDVDVFFSKTNFDRTLDGYKFPKFELGSTVSLQPLSRLYFTTMYRMVGERELPFFNPVTFSTEIQVAKSYHMLSEKISYSGLKSIDVFGSLGNILNQDYLDNLGYNSQERNFSIGLTWTVE